jgi:hypothetical protein
LIPHNRASRALHRRIITGSSSLRSQTCCGIVVVAASVGNDAAAAAAADDDDDDDDDEDEDGDADDNADFSWSGINTVANAFLISAARASCDIPVVFLPQPNRYLIIPRKRVLSRSDADMLDIVASCNDTYI